MSEFALSHDSAHILSVPSVGADGNEQPNVEEDFEAVHWDDATAAQDEETEEFPPASESRLSCLKIDAMLNHDPIPPSCTSTGSGEELQNESVILPVETSSKVRRRVVEATLLQTQDGCVSSTISSLITSTR